MTKIVVDEEFLAIAAAAEQSAAYSEALKLIAEEEAFTDEGKRFVKIARDAIKAIGQKCLGAELIRVI